MRSPFSFARAVASLDVELIKIKSFWGGRM
jgi:hypothetical protein